MGLIKQALAKGEAGKVGGGGKGRSWRSESAGLPPPLSSTLWQQQAIGSSRVTVGLNPSVCRQTYPANGKASRFPSAGRASFPAVAQPGRRPQRLNGQHPLSNISVGDGITEICPLFAALPGHDLQTHSEPRAA